MFISEVLFIREDNAESFFVPSRFLKNFKIEKFTIEECYVGAKFILEKVSETDYCLS